MSTLKLELVPVPVADIDAAKKFYTEKIGFHADHDVQSSETTRILQLTPPGSACSILLSSGLPEISEMQPGSVKGLHLVVPDIHAVLSQLAEHGVHTSDLIEYPGGIKMSGFHDPDGNGWVLQELPAKA